MVDDLSKELYHLNLKLHGGDMYRLLTAVSIQITEAETINPKTKVMESKFRSDNYRRLHDMLLKGSKKIG